MWIAHKIREFVRMFVFGSQRSSEAYIKSLRKKGVRIGDGTTIHDSTTVFIDPTRPWMIEIGKNVQITRGVTILTHGFDWSVLKGKYGDVLGSCGKVTIGNNCFVGMHSTILKGVTIGDNVIIGANSLVNHDIPSNSVVGGVPAQSIMTLEEYYEKRQKEQIYEAQELVRNYRLVYGVDPDEEAMSEFFWLFSDDGNVDCMPPSWRHQMRQAGNEAYSSKKLYLNKKKWADMRDFLESVKH